MQFSCAACGHMVDQSASTCTCGVNIGAVKACTSCNGKGNAGKPRPPLRRYVHPDDYVKCLVCQGLGAVASAVKAAETRPSA
jgi:hypothetical protein